jgi:ParB-like chromosome segregation protein Spo0J
MGNEKGAHASHGQVSRFDGLRYMADFLVIRGEFDKTDPLRDPRLDKPVPESLIQLIRVFGFIGTMLVRKNGKHKEGKYKGQWIIEVIDGRKRLQALRIVNKERIAAGLEPFVVAVTIEADCSDEKFLALTKAMNAGRTTTDAITMARGASQDMQLFGKTIKEVALTSGVTVEVMKSYMKLLGLHPDVQLAIQAEVFSPTAATILLDLPQHEQVPKMKEMIEAGAAFGVAAEKAAKAATAETRPPKSAPRPKMLAGAKVAKFSARLDDAKTRNKSAGVVLGIISKVMSFVRREITEEDIAQALDEAGIELAEDEDDEEPAEFEDKAS